MENCLVFFRRVTEKAGKTPNRFDPHDRRLAFRPCSRLVRKQCDRGVCRSALARIPLSSELFCSHSCETKTSE